jgi:hypothetical protein
VLILPPIRNYNLPRFNTLTLDLFLSGHGDLFYPACIELAAALTESWRHLATSGGERHAQVLPKMPNFQIYLLSLLAQLLPDLGQDLTR